MRRASARLRPAGGNGRPALLRLPHFRTCRQVAVLSSISGYLSVAVRMTACQIQNVDMKRTQVLADHAVKPCTALAASSPQVGFGIAREAILFQCSTLMPVCEDQERFRIDMLHVACAVAPGRRRPFRIDAVPLAKIADCFRD